VQASLASKGGIQVVRTRGVAAGRDVDLAGFPMTINTCARRASQAKQLAQIIGENLPGLCQTI
jgi:hypothetical protein